MSIEQITPLETQARIAGGNTILIDVRELDEYKEAYIHGAVLVPMSQCHPAALPANPDKQIIFYCRKGGRSQKVGEHYQAAFPHQAIANMTGGIDAWIAAGLPVSHYKE